MRGRNHLAQLIPENEGGRRPPKYVLIFTSSFIPSRTRLRVDYRRFGYAESAPSLTPLMYVLHVGSRMVMNWRS